MSTHERFYRSEEARNIGSILDALKNGTDPASLIDNSDEVELVDPVHEYYEGQIQLELSEIDGLRVEKGKFQTQEGVESGLVVSFDESSEYHPLEQILVQYMEGSAFFRLRSELKKTRGFSAQHVDHWLKKNKRIILNNATNPEAITNVFNSRARDMMAFWSKKNLGN